MAPDLELRGREGGGGGGLDLLALLAFFLSVISSFFTQNKGVPGPPGPSPRSATSEGLNCACDFERFSFECRKTKTKVITLANHKEHRQYTEPIKTRSNYM